MLSLTCKALSRRSQRSKTLSPPSKPAKPQFQRRRMVRRHPTPCTLHLTPYTLHSALYTLHPTPCMPSIPAPSSLLLSLRGQQMPLRVVHLGRSTCTP